MNHRLERLKAIYDKARLWSGDKVAARRVLAAINPRARLALVAEAVGPRTLRLSGVNYFDCEGHLGATGRNLDRLLTPLGYTLFPPSNIRVSNGMISSDLGGGRKTAYCTDLCPVFPGHDSTRKENRRIRRPKAAIIRSALKEEFLRQELNLIKPTVILLLGGHAYKFFYHYFLNEPIRFNLSRVVNEIRTVDLPTYRGATVVPFFHPSPANLSSVRWFASFPNSPPSKDFIDRVKSLLEKRARS